MYVRANSLDDLLAKVYQRLLTRGTRIEPTKGPAREIYGVLLKLSAPRLRLSRTESRGILFSGLGELLWILAGSNALDFIEHYISDYTKSSDDGLTIHGAYGPRIFGKRPNNQLARVISSLKTKPDSRQAVVQLFDRRDTLEYHRDIPCTCTMQFVIRDRRLHMLTSMRSNDAWLGLPHDVFAFTMIQELVARSLGVELGEYTHSVGSLHLYERDDKKAIRYLDEGWQPRRPMPPMPKGDPWTSVQTLLDFEVAVRSGDVSAIDPRESMAPYWADLATLLAIHKAGKTTGNQNEIKRLKRRLHDDVYAMYINKRYGVIPSVKDQVTIFDGSNETSKATA
ncbi:thymidylate synthase [Aquabacterium sp.]|uniref:thymidylate synthase n=1 Tax=Aquabacterium sp. TaxID=1872578 RepID=UPI002486E2ED|nr:thymidylate synthase [Aquabacterium sp.]MDI1260833.1 thymidylate synthase [Aquabacterium sp.]